MEENEAVLGIDPGNEGGAAFIWPEAGLMDVYDMPTFTIEKPLTAAQKKAKIARWGADALLKGKGTSSRTFINLANLSDVLRPEGEPPVKGFIESVASRPTDGAVQAFSFGRAFGNAEMGLACFRIPSEYVKPAVWKKFFHIGADKDEARRKATQLMPHCAHLWKLVKHDGRAEAALIAYWGCLQLGYRMTKPLYPTSTCGVLLAA